MRGKLLTLIAPAFLAIVSFAVAGCNSGGNTSVPVVQCTLPTANTVVSLVYPVPGATSVPDNIGNVIIATNVALPSNWQVILLPPQGLGILGGLLTTTLPSPLPSPNAVPTPAASASPLILQASSFGQSGVYPATNFQVGLNNTASNCNSYPIIGTFTSQ